MYTYPSELPLVLLLDRVKVGQFLKVGVFHGVDGNPEFLVVDLGRSIPVGCECREIHLIIPIENSDERLKIFLTHLMIEGLHVSKAADLSFQLVVISVLIIDTL